MKDDWNPGTWVLIWEYSARAFRWTPTWQGLDALHPCALDESSLSIGRVNFVLKVTSKLLKWYNKPNIKWNLGPYKKTKRFLPFWCFMQMGPDVQPILLQTFDVFCNRTKESSQYCYKHWMFYATGPRSPANIGTNIECFMQPDRGVQPMLLQTFDILCNQTEESSQYCYKHWMFYATRLRSPANIATNIECFMQPDRGVEPILIPIFDVLCKWTEESGQYCYKHWVFYATGPRSPANIVTNIECFMQLDPGVQPILLQTLNVLCNQTEEFSQYCPKHWMFYATGPRSLANIVTNIECFMQLDSGVQPILLQTFDILCNWTEESSQYCYKHWMFYATGPRSPANIVTNIWYFMQPDWGVQPILLQTSNVLCNWTEEFSQYCYKRYETVLF